MFFLNGEALVHILLHQELASLHICVFSPSLYLLIQLHLNTFGSLGIEQLTETSYSSWRRWNFYLAVINIANEEAAHKSDPSNSHYRSYEQRKS
jgi:hypothetical protein